MQFQGKELITFGYLNRNNYHLKIDKKRKREKLSMSFKLLARLWQRKPYGKLNRVQNYSALTWEKLP